MHTRIILKFQINERVQSYRDCLCYMCINRLKTLSVFIPHISHSWFNFRSFSESINLCKCHTIVDILNDLSCNETINCARHFAFRLLFIAFLCLCFIVPKANEVPPAAAIITKQKLKQSLQKKRCKLQLTRK